MTSSITGKASLTGYVSNAEIYKVSYNKPIIGDIQWKLTASSRKGSPCNKLDVELVCLQKNNASKAWFCDVEIEFKCLGVDGEMITKHIDHCFKNSEMRCKVETFAYLLKSEKSFVVDAFITLKPKKNIPTIQRTDFGIPRNTEDEIVLLVGDRKVYVNKHLLMSHSTLFTEMLSSEGNDQKEIVIKDVKYEDMVAFLRYLSLEKDAVSHENINGFLTLAASYNVRNLMVYCEAALMNTNKITTIEKLCLSDKYKLQALQKEVMGTITKAEIVTMFEDIDKFKIDTKTKDALLVKVCTMEDDKSRIKPYYEKFYNECRDLPDLEQIVIVSGLLFIFLFAMLLFIVCVRY